MACKAGSLHYKDVFIFYSDSGLLRGYWHTSASVWIFSSVADKCGLTNLEMVYIVLSQVNKSVAKVLLNCFDRRVMDRSFFQK